MTDIETMAYMWARAEPQDQGAVEPVLFFPEIKIAGGVREMTEENDLHYFVLGTRNPGEWGEKTKVGAPWKVYAVSEVDNFGIGRPPYFRVNGFDKDEAPVLEELVEGSQEYGRVQKWVGSSMYSQDARNSYKRKLFCTQGASGVVSKYTALDILKT